MIYLISSILASSFIFVIFKLFDKFKIDTLQAIVFNYFMACGFGFLLFGNQLTEKAFTNLNWLPFVIICGVLFIVSFLIMGLSAQKNGVAMTSVSVKMSMAMSMLLMIFWNGEAISALKIIGIILAFLGVILMSWSSNSDKIKSQKPILWMLFMLFVGGGILDFTLNYTQNNVLQNLPSSLFSSIGFGISGLIGLIVVFYSIFTGKSKFQFKNLIAGIILGIPNYFSIYLLLESYHIMEEKWSWSGSTVLAVTNVSIVILTAFTGFIAFREQVTSRKIIGLIASISAIVTLYFASL